MTFDSITPPMVRNKAHHPCPTPTDDRNAARPQTIQHPPMTFGAQQGHWPRMVVAGTRTGVHLIPATLRRCFRWGDHQSSSANASWG